MAHDPQHFFYCSEEEKKSLREGEQDLIKKFLGDKESESVVIFTENLVLDFLEVTIDFKGGGESQFLAETARVIEDAYLRQIPSQIKGVLPDRLRIELTENESKPRFRVEILECNTIRNTTREIEFFSKQYRGSSF